ncbi:hypothetical protein Agub_g10168, partial [Astrephomene gubernaculifera]
AGAAAAGGGQAGGVPWWEVPDSMDDVHDPDGLASQSMGVPASTQGTATDVAATATPRPSQQQQRQLALLRRAALADTATAPEAAPGSHQGAALDTQERVHSRAEEQQTQQQALPPPQQWQEQHHQQQQQQGQVKAEPGLGLEPTGPCEPHTGPHGEQGAHGCAAAGADGRSGGATWRAADRAGGEERPAEAEGGGGGDGGGGGVDEGQDEEEGDAASDTTQPPDYGDDYDAGEAAVEQQQAVAEGMVCDPWGGQHGAEHEAEATAVMLLAPTAVLPTQPLDEHGGYGGAASHLQQPHPPPPFPQQQPRQQLQLLRALPTVPIDALPPTLALAGTDEAAMGEAGAAAPVAMPPYGATTTT